MTAGDRVVPGRIARSSHDPVPPLDHSEQQVSLLHADAKHSHGGNSNTPDGCDLPDAPCAAVPLGRSSSTSCRPRQGRAAPVAARWPATTRDPATTTSKAASKRERGRTRDPGGRATCVPQGPVNQGQPGHPGSSPDLGGNSGQALGSTFARRGVRGSIPLVSTGVSRYGGDPHVLGQHCGGGARSPPPRSGGARLPRLAQGSRRGSPIRHGAAGRAPGGVPVRVRAAEPVSRHGPRRANKMHGRALGALRSSSAVSARSSHYYGDCSADLLHRGFAAPQPLNSQNE